MKGVSHLHIADSIDTAALPEHVLVPGTDVKHLVVDQLKIEEARTLKNESARKPLHAPVLSFVIQAKDITLEAQNALLKLFEEPSQDTEFYIVVPRESILLPTLRSRFIDAKQGHKSTNAAEDFLAMSYKDRMSWIADNAKKDPEALTNVVTKLGQIDSAKWSEDGRRSLLLASRYVYNRGASRKMLLEELALSL